VVREPLILSAGGAELKSYTSAAQAVLFLFLVPAYGWLQIASIADA
jgi:AAA family ATP:ADP antiporter